MNQTCIFIVIGIILIGLTCCSQETKKQTLDKQTENANMFIGDWKSVKRMIPYSSELTINNDKTYKYSYGASLFRGFSTGKWTLTDSILTLNSFPTDTCLFLREFGIDCLTAEQIEKYKPKTTTEDCIPENTDEYVLFQEVRFKLIGDTLKHIFTEEKLCPEIRNDFYRP
jgi:hypothetical protein